MKLSREQQFFTFVMGILVVSGLIFLHFNDRGYRKYRALRQEVDSLNSVIMTLETENKMLQNSIDSLDKKIPAKINRLARERHKMKLPGETVINVDEK